MIDYQYDQTGLSISEKTNGDDLEFVIQVKDEAKYLQAIHEVRTYFEKNNVYTDVLFYTHPHNEYQVIVRKDFYVDFLSCLFKHHILESLVWK